MLRGVVGTLSRTHDAVKVRGSGSDKSLAQGHLRRDKGVLRSGQPKLEVG